jgi:hypothetical protein
MLRLKYWLSEAEPMHSGWLEIFIVWHQHPWTDGGKSVLFFMIAYILDAAPQHVILLMALTRAIKESRMKIKTHLVMPGDVVAEVDRIAGKRRRSLFIVEATREKLAKERFIKVLEETSGAWSDSNHPDLMTTKSVENYVREKRQAYGKRLKRSRHE